MTPSRLKLLLIASGCDSAAIGEGWYSWQWVSRLGRRHDVTLLTIRNNRQAPIAEQLPGVRVVEWPDFRLFEKWQRFNSTLKPGYAGLHFRARRWLKRYLRSGGTFDLVHQISPLALRYPCPAAGLGIPTIIGPLAGSIETPEAFRTEMKASPWYTKLRAVDAWRLRHDPLLRRSYAEAACIICVAPYVRDLLGNLVSRDAAFMSEIGVAQLPPRTARTWAAGPLRLLFVGRVIRSKGARDAIRAMALLSESPGLRLDLVGDGDDLAACQKEAQALGVGDRIVFHGRVPRKEVDRFYAQADVFVFPSFREPSGNVVLEAMSYGLAMIVADEGGPAFVVDKSCGFRVPVTTPQEYARQIADCIHRLVVEPGLAAEMGAAARAKIARQHLWDAKIDQLMQVYEAALTGTSPSRRGDAALAGEPAAHSVAAG